MAIIHKECNSIVKIDHSFEALNQTKQRESFRYDADDLKITEKKSYQNIDVVIVGGGLIGCGIACQLRKLNNKLNLLIVDDNDYLIQSFTSRTSHIEQSVMRSPYDHQIAPDGDIQLVDFGRLYISKLTPTERKQLNNALAGQRGIVPIDLFIYHAVHVVNNYGLKHLAHKSRVSEVTFNPKLNKCHTVTPTGIIESKYVIIATGLKQKKSLNEYNYDRSVFSAYENLASIRTKENIAVVGSGLTAGHYILKLLRNKVNVTWIIRKSEEVYKCTDITSKYFRTEGISYFQQLLNEEKESILNQENSGSLMIEFHDYFNQLESNGTIKIIRDFDIQKISKVNSKVEIQSQNREAIFFDKIVDCTGLEVSKDILPKDVEFVGNYPVLNDNNSLQKHKNIFVAGALASWLLGPGSKNIEGIRLATESFYSTYSQDKAISNYITGHRKI